MAKLELEIHLTTPADIKLKAATATLAALRDMVADAEVLVAKYAIEANQPASDDMLC